MPSPRISIVVSAYNRAGFLSATLESIRAQTVEDWECIVVDDGSTDQTRAVAKTPAEADARFRVVFQENRGPAAARNRGFAEIAAGSEYVTFMDSDDIWLPDALETLSNELEKFPHAVGAHGLANHIDENGLPLEYGFAEFGRTRFAYDSGEALKADVSQPTGFGMLAWENRVYPPGVLLARRRFYERTGPFDSALGRMDDWDMLVRLSRYGDLRFVNKAVLSYRLHGGNFSGTDPRQTQRVVRAIHYKTFFSPENTDAHRQALRKGWRALQGVHARERWRLFRKTLAKGRYFEAVTVLAGMYVQLHRYLRGCPARRGI